MIAVLTGAGISSDSGLATFRDSNGLWANHRIEDVCTPEALITNRAEVVKFYNERRREMMKCTPNAAHTAIARLARFKEVRVITQNIDDLHERAGSEDVIHLHGELRKLRSSRDEDALVDIEGWEQKMDERHADGSLLRPHVVFFGEAVPMMDEAIRVVRKADIVIVVGTSLNVYPAAGLVNYTSADVPIYIVDPAADDDTFKRPSIPNKVIYIARRGAVGVPALVDKLISECK